MAGNYNNNNRQQRAWNIWELKMLNLNGRPWNKDSRDAPRLIVSVTEKGSPRFRMYMNDGSKSGADGITFDEYSNVFPQMMAAIKRIADDKTAQKAIFKIKSWFANGRERLPKPATTAVVTVGRDGDGYVYISVQMKGKDVAVFPFGNHGPTIEVVGGDGEPLSPEIFSSDAANGWVDKICRLTDIYMVLHTQEPPANPNGGNNGGGNRGGGYNNGGNRNGGGYNNNGGGGRQNNNWDGDSSNTGGGSEPANDNAKFVDDFEDDVAF